ncbi:TPA: hypothetical protein ACU967_002271 [Burkholderia contaminans]|uniref:hypothetical protein n=1 Tax=Burkholderia contaminans TaxID=488447 RepID=UPI0011B21E42|nr:hypothetical protein [Burkholderia contaminans]HDR9065513.1 hypothetical protein [Burkholderia vietnamiensis]MBM6427952.1 hypothetical protein [Burkholderia contaminans]MCA7876783.1 hypothetical protein [Burkholderia contaminans]MDN8024194.1 hypothetical protein [Burkholderia contaminans]HDR9071290.1 hypothetical protein [Burkholderia vietnamiensis]
MLTAIQFWKKVGTPKAREVCGVAGTTFEYFEHIAHGRKRPSETLANAIAQAALQLTGIKVDAAAMRQPKGETAESKREARRKERAAAFASTLPRANA